MSRRLVSLQKRSTSENRPLTGFRPSRVGNLGSRNIDIAPMIQAARDAGAISLSEIAAWLNENGIEALRGGSALMSTSQIW